MFQRGLEKRSRAGYGGRANIVGPIIVLLWSRKACGLILAVSGAVVIDVKNILISGSARTRKQKNH